MLDPDRLNSPDPDRFYRWQLRVYVLLTLLVVIGMAISLLRG